MNTLNRRSYLAALHLPTPPNRLIYNGNFSDSTTDPFYPKRVAFELQEDILKITKTEMGTNEISARICIPISLIANHKYYISCQVKREIGTSLYIVLGRNDGSTSGQGLLCVNINNTTFTPCSGVIFTTLDIINTYDHRNGIWLGVNRLGAPSTSLSPIGEVSYFKNIWMTDLTAAYGAGNEPAAEEFRVMYPEEYYEYNPIT